MDKNPYWDDFEAPAGTPADHKVALDAALAVSQTVPAPPGVEDIEDTAPPAANAVTGPDGSSVHFYTDRGTIYATLRHPDGYAEFRLRNGKWKYLPQPVVLWSGFTSTYLDDLDASLVKVPPPTLEEANRQSSA